jgi:hypothetical protein
VVIHDLNVCRSSLGPSKANAPLIIDANAVLAVADTLHHMRAQFGTGDHENRVKREARTNTKSALGE